MKRLLLLLAISAITIPAMAQPSTTELKIGTPTYVTIGGDNYQRGYLRSVYTISGSDTLIGINYTTDREIGQVFISPKKCSYYLDASRGDSAFRSKAEVMAWMNTNFEPSSTFANGNPITTVGKTFQVAVTPTVSTSSYTSGYVVGGIMTFAAMRVSNGTGEILSCLVTEKGTQDANLTILIFSQNPSTGTYTDHAAFTFNATDYQYLIRTITIKTTDYVAAGSYSAAEISSIGKDVFASGGNANLYAVAVTTSTPTYSASSNLTIKLGFLQD